MLVVGNESFETRSGGLSRYLEAFCNTLRDMGVSPSVVTSTADDPTWMPLRTLQLARRAHRQMPAHLLDVHFAPTGLIPILLSPKDTSIVVHFQGPWATETQHERGSKLGAGIRRVVERAAYLRADLIVTLSRDFASLVVDEYGVDPSRVVTIPPGVDLDRFCPGPGSPSLGGFNLPPGQPVVVVARRLTSRMGVDTLIRAWPEIRRHSPALLIVVGSGPERATLEGMVSDLALDGSVRFLGHVSDSDLVAAYRSASLSVVPTRALEGFGLVVLESLACGTAVVASDVGGLRDAVSPLDPTLLVPPGDPHALALRIAAALAGDAPDSASCRSYAEQFSWARVAERHLQLYQQRLRS